MVTIFVMNDRTVVIERPAERMLEISNDAMETVYDMITKAEKEGTTVSLQDIANRLREKYTNEEEFLLALDDAIAFIKDWRESYE